MDAFICTTCGTQYSPSELPPLHCLICEEERQFVLPTGQAWTTLGRLHRTHMATFRDDGGIMGIGMKFPTLVSRSELFWCVPLTAMCCGIA